MLLCNYMESPRHTGPVRKELKTWCEHYFLIYSSGTFIKTTSRISRRRNEKIWATEERGREGGYFLASGCLKRNNEEDTGEINVEVLALTANVAKEGQVFHPLRLKFYCRPGCFTVFFKFTNFIHFVAAGKLLTPLQRSEVTITRLHRGLLIWNSNRKWTRR